MKAQPSMQWTSEMLVKPDVPDLFESTILDALSKERAESAFAFVEGACPICPEGTIIVSLHSTLPLIQEWDEEEPV